MNSDSKLKQSLTQLGDALRKGGSIPDQVMQQVRGLPIPHRPRRAWRILMKTSLAAAALICIGVILALHTWTDTSSLYGDVVKGFREANTIHMTMTPDAMHSCVEIWYDKAKGLRIEGRKENVIELVYLDDGATSWQFDPVSGKVIKAASGGDLPTMMAKLTGAEFLNEKVRHVPDGDKKVDGDLWEQYVMDRKYSDGAKEADEQLVAWLDSHKRIHEIETRRLVDGKWVRHDSGKIEYDVAIDEKLFSPQFGKEVNTHDVKKMLDDLLSLKVAQNEGLGLQLTVHKVVNWEDKGVLVLLSLRPTQATIKEFGEPSWLNREFGDFVMASRGDNIAILKAPGLQASWWLIPWPDGKPTKEMTLSVNIYARGKLNDKLFATKQAWHKTLPLRIVVPASAGTLRDVIAKEYTWLCDVSGGPTSIAAQVSVVDAVQTGKSTSFSTPDKTSVDKIIEVYHKTQQWVQDMNEKEKAVTRPVSAPR